MKKGTLKDKNTGYVKGERLIGEILVVLGVIIIFVYELYVFINYLKSDKFHMEPSFVSIFLIVLGLFFLLMSVFREQVFSSKKQRYKDVDK